MDSFDFSLPKLEVSPEVRRCFEQVSQLAQELTLSQNERVCPQCFEHLISSYCHDFRKCSCGYLFIDGGKEYLRMGIDTTKKIEFNMYDIDHYNDNAREFSKEHKILPLTSLFLQILFQRNRFPYPQLIENLGTESVECYEVCEEFQRLAYENGSPTSLSKEYLLESIGIFWDECSYVNKVEIVKSFIGWSKRKKSELGIELTDEDLDKSNLMTESING